MVESKTFTVETDGNVSVSTLADAFGETPGVMSVGCASGGWPDEIGETVKVQALYFGDSTDPTVISEEAESYPGVESVSPVSRE